MDNQDATSDEWARKVGRTFNTNPVIAIKESDRWMHRAEEKKLRMALVSPGGHVCLYGPSGSGKTSLAKSIAARLARKGSRFIYTRISHSTDWSKFKSQIVENKTGDKQGLPLSYKIGIANLLPYIEISGHHESLPRPELIEGLDIYHIAQTLNDLKATLIVDDVNFASDDLLMMLTSLSKEILDTSPDGLTKMLFVGADDIFLRMLRLNNSLKDRTEEIALGSIRGDDGKPSTVRGDKVWKFICDGLVALGLRDPRLDQYFSREDRIAAIKWIEKAADGLPKSVVVLGKKLAEKGEGRSRISLDDFSSTSREMVRRNFRNYRGSYRSLFSHLRRDELCSTVVDWMFKSGASAIFRLDEIAEDLTEVASYTMFHEAIMRLAKEGFLVVTGAEENVFFAQDPLLAHTIGVVMNEPDIVGFDPKYFAKDQNPGQLRLRFIGDKDPEVKREGRK